MEKVAVESGTDLRQSKSSYRRRRLIRIGALFLGIFFVAAMALLAALWPFHEAKVRESLEESLGGKITVGHYRSTFFPHPGAIADDVAFHWQTKSAEEVPLVFVKRLTIKANYYDLLLRPGYISEVLLAGLRIHVPPRGSPTDSTQTPAASTRVRTRVGEVRAEDGLLEIERQKGEELVFQLHALELASVSEGQPFGFRVAMRIPLPPGEVRATGQFGPWNSQNAADTRASGTYSYQDADLSVFPGIAGRLWSEGEFRGTLGQLPADGKVEIPDFEVTRSRHSVPVKSEYQAVVNATNGDVQLQNVDGFVVQTRVIARGSVARKPGQHGKTTSIDFTVREGRIQDVLRLFVKARRPPLNGTTGFQAHVTVPPGNAAFLKKVELSGDFGVSNGGFTAPETQENIAKLSETGAGKKPKEGEDPDPDAVVSALAGHVELRGGVATFSDFSFSVPDAEANMHGTYNLIDEKIDLHGLLRTTAKFSNTTSGFKSVLLKPFDAVFKRKHHSGAKVPVQLTGTYDNPHAGLEILK